ncbi:hypothetical protein ACFX2I_008008 [Malus domestica]
MVLTEVAIDFANGDRTGMRKLKEGISGVVLFLGGAVPLLCRSQNCSGHYLFLFSVFCPLFRIGHMEEQW